jgi:hypothetical protein
MPVDLGITPAGKGAQRIDPDPMYSTLIVAVLLVKVDTLTDVILGASWMKSVGKAVGCALG